MSQINVDVISPYSLPEITLSGDVATNILNASSLATDGSGKIYSPYNSYVAKLTQTTTGDPTSNIFQNTLGGTLVWTRVATGSYEGTLSAAFSSGNVHLLYNSPLSTNKIYFYNAADPDIVYIDCVDASTGLPVDYDGDELYIEIKVYP